ncbi:VPLPA-CTERM sorting domain-containing protein [Pseudodesulfovibrio portus]|uniref:Uncharacterized protein n=1 Tax=Pseudodesulfovibrio portus TaxID=231439 RepID=A0ABM8AQ62_9BACT|nr:VPLPA-CTERM sorting domain-containing protein [Pseudodesulfovibrio portus]BDQ33456.1 hypothetical protein JCM14722_09980 [Pseudodesulfovibrio portus]
MKYRASIIVLIMTLLFASSAFASSLVIHTGFEQPAWDTDLYGEGWSRGMDFVGYWAPGDGGAGINNDGSVIGYSGSTLGIRFVAPNEQRRPAEQFTFTYQAQENPIYLTIDMSGDLNSVGFDANNSAQYFRAEGQSGDNTDGFQFVDYSGDSLIFVLTGTTTTYPAFPNEPDLDPSFSFYMNNGFETLLNIDALYFSSYNPIDQLSGLESLASDGGDVVVELTAFDYTPTPIPGAAWLLGSGLIGLVGLRRRFKA